MKKIVAAGIAVVVLIAGTTVWAYRRHRVDPKVQKVVELQRQLENKDLTDEQALAIWRQRRAAMQGLSESQQRQAWQQGFARGARGMNMAATAAAYCKAAPDQRGAIVNQFLADMQERQRRWDLLRADDRAQNGSSGQAGSNGQAGGGPGGGPGGGGPGGGGPGGGGPGGGGPGGRPGRFDQQGRNQGRLRMLDNTTPEQRAQMTVFRQGVQQQCQQQGITPPRGFGGGGRF